MLEPRRSWPALLCWLTVLIEGFDLVSLGAASLALRNADHLQMTPARLTLVATLSLVGVAVGAAFVTPLADVLGRRRVLIGSVAAFSVFTLLQPLAPNVGVFAALRLIAGLGLGSCMPTALATMSDAVPVERRARASTTTMTGYHVGAVAAALLALAVHDAWQVLFYVGGAAGLVLSAAMWARLPETAAVKVPAAESEKVTIVDLVRPGRLRTTLAVWISTFMGLLLVYGLNTWLPNLMKNAGYSVSTSVTLLFVLNAGGVIGMLLAGHLADTRGITRTVLAWFGLGGVLLAVLSIRIDSAALLNVIIFLTGLFVFSAQVLVYAYVAHTHPQRIRGSALGITSGVGRIGAIVGPSITGVLVSAGIADPWGFYFFALAAFLGLAAMAVAPHVGRVGAAGAADPSSDPRPATAQRA
jgi:MFS transporter, AAHS family, benzoate transport protein